MKTDDNDITTRIVLVEKTNAYPLRKLEIVKQTWRKGKHPKTCIGNCKMQSGVFAEYCNVCGWDNF